MGRYRVSVDIGGTFTDLVFYDVLTGEYKEGKTLSTPNNLSDAIIKGLSEKITDYSEIDFFVNGTTAGINTFLERKGAKIALITTKGFRDIYEISRGNKEEMYNLNYKKPTPFVKRSAVFEIEERILSDGTVETELKKEDVIRITQEIKKAGYESIAICLINAYVNPDHEIEIEKLIREALPNNSISVSYKIAREWREYERTTTTVINAYIAPIVQKYLEFLEEQMSNKGFDDTIYIMQSGGGIINTFIAKESPIQTLLSGPVGGAVGNKTLSEVLQYKNLIGVDMGGTSYDVSIIIDGKSDVTVEKKIDGFPILAPMINIHSIGAGGGSIAWIEGGGLRVGPISAGANPGPACYGKGGLEPTITDANLVLGRIDPENFFGGNMVLDKNSAINVVKRIADELNLTVEETAEGICKIADVKMADAIKQLTIRKGINPREFVLVSFGGAGPMHACLTSEELGIDTILVPKMPGVFSAWGMLQSDIRKDTVRTLRASVDNISLEEMNATYKEMIGETSEFLVRHKIEKERMEYQRIADMRYLGQEYMIRVPFEPGIITLEMLKKLTETFHKYHHKIYGHSNPNERIEIVNVRLVGLGKLDKILQQKEKNLYKSEPKPRKINEAIFYGRKCETRFFNRRELKSGQKLVGPAVIEEPTTTIVIPPGYEVTIDEYKNILIKRK